MLPSLVDSEDYKGRLIWKSTYAVIIKRQQLRLELSSCKSSVNNASDCFSLYETFILIFTLCVDFSLNFKSIKILVFLAL